MMRFLRSIHAWMGVLVMPWIIMIGLTGLYLNHSKMVNSVLYDSEFNDSNLASAGIEPVVNTDFVKQLASKIWGREYRGSIKQGKYHKHNVFVLQARSTRLLVSKKTGQYWLKTSYTRKTYDAEGELRHTKIYWGRIFKRIHTDGWVDRGLGSWLADIAAASMVIFGFSGIVLFLYPRVRRFKSRRLRASSQANFQAN